MEKEKTIYELELNETIVIYTSVIGGTNQDTQRMFVTRVAGGWIYCQVVGVNNSVNQIFVPLNNEFNPLFK